MRKLLPLLMAFISCLPVLASYNVVTVNLKDKTQVDIAISSELKISFSDTDLIASGGEKEILVSKDKIVNFTHSYDSSLGIDAVSAEAFELSDGGLIMRGLPEGSVVNILTTSGVLVSSKAASGDVVISFTELDKGIYIVNVNKNSFKITVK